MTLPQVKAKLLDGKKGLIVGIANDRSIAWGCARAFRAFGADLAITYLNEKAKPHVEPLAREVEAPIFMALDVTADGQIEAVFERITKEWASSTSSCIRSPSPPRTPWAEGWSTCRGRAFR
jgi:enoyl-[acyl-carrier protein] reductase I